MMGKRQVRQEALFYGFSLESVDRRAEQLNAIGGADLS